ncbi:MAG: ATP-binding cassette domain-containing protein [Gammaproteobacteria bacterium]|nr:ATP-binding cassette domain-containing protein [Gammaproteobacteria bacterium]
MNKHAIQSTILKLILGLQKPQSGKLLFDGLELEMLGLDTLRDQVSGVLHGDTLLSGDIAYNINLGREPANEQRLITASTRSGLHDLIRRLPLGYRTRVGEMGNSFSAGQVQRILIARALFRLPRILILDEALSRLGPNATVQLLETIRGLGITTIIVSHDPSLRLLADLEVTIAGASLDT